MSRYIYITDDCLMDIAYEHMDDNALIGLQNALEEIPTADVVEVVHGKWIKVGATLYVCSKCGRTIDGRTDENINNECFPYCHCGAKMDEGEKMARYIDAIPTADVVSKEKYDELNERYHRLLESAKILSDAVSEYERREDGEIH